MYTRIICSVNPFITLSVCLSICVKNVCDTPAPAAHRSPYMSHHHTYYVTSSYTLCHIIIHTMSHHQQLTAAQVPKHVREIFTVQ